MTLPQLFFAGRALLTFHNQETGGHMTVKVTQAKDKQDRKKRLPIFFVNVSLLGDGDQGFRFAGTIFKDTMTFRPGKSIEPGDKLSKVLPWLMHAVQNPQTLREKGVALLHEGKCCRCALPLTNPASIERGLGDDCHAYVFGTDNAALKKKLGLVWPGFFFFLRITNQAKNLSSKPFILTPNPINMTNQFSPYEQALALKELGFDEPCLGFYNHQGQLILMTQEDENSIQVYKNSYVKLGKQYAAPTYSQAFRFFREKYNIDSWVQPFTSKKSNGDLYLPDESYSYFIFKDGVWVADGVDFLEPEEAELACLKKLIQISTPTAFPKDSKYFDFSKHVSNKGKFFVSADVCESLGLVPDFIQVRNTSNPETHHRSFFLSNSYKWELKFDGDAMVLIPTRK